MLIVNNIDKYLIIKKYIYTYRWKTYHFCVEVFEKTIIRTEMIDHSFESKQVNVGAY